MPLAKSLLIAVATSLAVIGADARCPSNIPPVYTEITQVFNGIRTKYDWVISPTKHANAADGKTSPCPSPAYVVQWDVDGCSSTSALVANAPLPGTDKCSYAFNDDDKFRTMNLEITCDKGSSKLTMDPSVNVVSSGGLTYSFKGTYAGVCEGSSDDDGDGGGDKKSGGCGGGCIFVILFFVGAVLYVAGTVAFNYFKLGKRGKELAPHPEFWLLIPGLIKDGAVFSFQMVTKPCRKDSGGSSYTQV